MSINSFVAWQMFLSYKDNDVFPINLTGEAELVLLMSTFPVPFDVIDTSKQKVSENVKSGVSEKI